LRRKAIPGVWRRSQAQAKEHPGSGHRERLRDKFLEHGLDKFKDDEVLELLLTLATPRRDCKQPARELLAKQGGLSGVLDAEPELLAAVKGSRTQRTSWASS
jgi:DNA repair protein RadC